MTIEQMHEISKLSAFYGRYPQFKAVWTEYQDGSVHYQASLLSYKVDEHDDEGTFPESQWHWIEPDGHDSLVRS